MFLADLLDLKEHRVKLASNEGTQAHFMLHHGGHFSTLLIWTLNMERGDQTMQFKVRDKNGPRESNLQLPTVWQLVFQVHSQPIVLGFTVFYIVRYRLLSFKFLFCFTKKPALATHTHNKSHLKIVAQILRKKGRKSLNQRRKKKIKSNL